MQYTIAQLEALVNSAGQGSKPRREHASTGNVPLTSLPSFVRDVRQEILVAVKLSKGRMSRREIARSVGLKKSGYLKRLLDELVDKGHLREIPGRWQNGVVMYFYEVTR